MQKGIVKFYYQFQFTHPGRGATRLLPQGSLATPVSIHAPREGCDFVFNNAKVFLGVFQFTHPGRGATKTYSLEYLIQCSFNSRTPGGVRQAQRL